MRLTDSETRKIISDNKLKFRDDEQRHFLIELTEETHDEFCLQVIIFAKRLGSYLQYMIEKKGRKIIDVLDYSVIECDLDNCVTPERRRLAIKLLTAIWAYGDELDICTNSDGTTKKN